MAYKFYTTKQFDKDVKRCQKRGLPMEKLVRTIKLLVENGHLPPQYRSHKLKGNFHNVWECHIQPDWLLVWKQDNDKMIMIMTNTGTHADLFE